MNIKDINGLNVDAPQVTAQPTRVEEVTNDTENSRKYVSEHTGRILWNVDSKRWLAYDGKRWARDDSTPIELAKETAKGLLETAKNSIMVDDRSQLIRWAKSSNNLDRINAMISLAKSDPKLRITNSELDGDAFMFNAANGTVDLRRLSLLEHDANRKITKLSEAKFDYSATCPKWMEFLDQAMQGDKGLLSYIQKLVGYSLTGSNNESQFYILNGPGANGKSVFLTVIRKLMGDYSAATDFTTFLEKKGDRVRDDLAALRGCRVVTASEIGVGKHLDETVLKQTTGGDSISVRELYGDYFEYKPEYKIFLATNHLPRIVGTENGIWRRVRVIPWSVIIPEHEQNKNLAQELLAELDGILTWALEGCKAWQQEGLEAPRKVLEEINSYRESADNVFDFVGNVCVKQNGQRTNVKDMYRKYDSWCTDSGCNAVAEPLFRKRMEELGIERHKIGTYQWIGIRPKTAVELEHDADISHPLDARTVGDVGLTKSKMDWMDNVDPFSEGFPDNVIWQNDLELVQKVQDVQIIGMAA